MNESSESPAADQPLETKHSSASNRYVLLFGCVMLVGLVALAWIGRPKRITMAGEKLPIVDLQPLLFSDSPLSNGELEGKMTLLHFWGTWCPPCQQEFPDFIALTKEFENEEALKIVSISCSNGPEMDIAKLRAETETFLAKRDFQVPTFADSTAMTRQQFAMLSPIGSFGLPTTVLVGKDGVIITSLDGYYPGEMEKLADVIRENL